MLEKLLEQMAEITLFFLFSTPLVELLRTLLVGDVDQDGTDRCDESFLETEEERTETS
jgi:hypothetical protein